MIAFSRRPLHVELKHYDQSSKCVSKADSSVSYVAAVVADCGDVAAK